jgi:peptide/nickel transport system substrate-binding protein
MSPVLLRGPRLLVLASAVALASCVPRDRPKSTLTILLPDDILTLDPNKDVEEVTDSVLFNVFEPLVGFDVNLERQTLLAESWEHPVPEQWRFHLRKDVRFHDGTPLTAAIARDALLGLKQSRLLEAAHFLSQVERVAAADDHTLDIVTREPRAILASLPFVYISKPSAQGGGAVVGTGPYKIRERLPGKRITLERWSGYWGAAPEFNDVTFVPERDPSARLAALRNGDADVIYGVEPEQTTKRLPGVRFRNRPGLAVYYLGFGFRKGADNPFQKLEVRQAVHLALDRKGMVEHLLLGMGSVATQPVAPVIFGYDPDLPAPAFDPLRARQLLSRAGYPHGFRVRIDFLETRLPEVRLVQKQLREVGVELELNSLEKTAFYQLMKTHKTDLFFTGWDCSTGEASEFYEICLHTPTDRYGIGNFGEYSNPVVDEVSETNAAILDQRSRRRKLQEAAAITMDDLPVVPLFIRDEIYAVRDYIDFDPRADSEIKLLELRRAPR